MNVVANDLMQAAKDLEMHVKSGSLENALELLEKIRKEYGRLIEYDLKKYDKAETAGMTV